MGLHGLRPLLEIMCQNFDSKDPRTKAVTEPNFITQKIFDAVIIIISQAGVGFCVGFCTTPKTYTLHGKLTFPSNASALLGKVVILAKR